MLLWGTSCKHNKVNISLPAFDWRRHFSGDRSSPNIYECCKKKYIKCILVYDKSEKKSSHFSFYMNFIPCLNMPSRLKTAIKFKGHDSHFTKCCTEVLKYEKLNNLQWQNLWRQIYVHIQSLIFIFNLAIFFLLHITSIIIFTTDTNLEREYVCTCTSMKMYKNFNVIIFLVLPRELDILQCVIIFHLSYIYVCTIDK